MLILIIVLVYIPANKPINRFCCQLPKYFMLFTDLKVSYI